MRSKRTGRCPRRLISTAVAAITLSCGLHGGTSTSHGAFPGENGKIAFSSTPGGQYQDIFTVNPDGTDVTRLTFSPPGFRSTQPDWSADGTRIAFTHVKTAAVETPAIYVANADGSDPRKLTDQRDLSPAWAPDGRRIAFVSFRSGTAAIYTMAADGTDQRLLAAGLSPSWSPRGDKIAYVDRSEGDSEIYVVNPDGTAPTKLTDNDFADVDPDWSPDGTKIAFTRPGPSGYHDVFTMNADGRDVTRLNSDNLHDFSPAWSPDGSQIVVDRGGHLYFMLNSGETRSLFFYGYSDTLPSWQPLVNRLPDCSGVRGSVDELLPANRRFREVTLEGASDPDGDAVSITIDGVTQDEPVTARGDHTRPDAGGDGDSVVRLRAERNPHGDGRVYRIAFTASDGRSGSCAGEVAVGVPRHKDKPAVDSAPPSYDSFAR